MTINIDFDYTCVIPDNTHETLGFDIGAVPVLKRLVKGGHKLILFTCRSNKPNRLENGHIEYHGLSRSIRWFDENEIPLYGVQRNPEQYRFTDSPKSLADLMIDDTALGIPLKYDFDRSTRPFVDWEQVEEMLEERLILKREEVC